MIKYEFLDVGLSYRPKCKFGAESMIVPAAITGGAGLFGSLFGASSASSNNSRSLAYSSAENERQRQWQQQMYGIQHSDMIKDTIASENRNNTEYNRRQELAMQSMKDMTDWIQKNYASPSAQAKAMRLAGFNPAMMLGAGGQGFATAAQNAPQVTSPISQYSAVGGMSSPLMSPPSLQNEGQIFSQGIESLSRSIANVVHADKTSAETKRLRATFDSYTATALAEKVSAQAAAESAQLRLSLDKLNLPKKYVLEIRKLQQDITSAVIFGDYQQAQTAYTEMQTKLSDIALKKGSIDLDYYRQQWQQHFQHISSQIALNESAKSLNEANTVQSYASAANLNAETKTINQLREFEVDLKRWDSMLAMQHHGQNDAKFSQELRILVNQANSSDFMPDTVKEDLRKAVKENDWFIVRQILGITNTAVGAYGAYKGAKTGEGFVNAQDVRNKIEGDWIEWQKSRGKTYEIHGFK